MLLDRLRTTVDADHSQYAVADHDADVGATFTTGGTGLIGPQGEVATVCTGTEYGPVRLTVEEHDGPPDPDPAAWDEVVDVSLDLPSATLVIRTLMSGHAAALTLAAGGGAYRLRIHARGRDDARDGPDEERDEPIEEHLIALWPADPAPDPPHAVVHKATDQIGAYHRRAEARKHSTVEFRTEPAVWSNPDWIQWPNEPGVQVLLDQPVLRSARLDITVTAVTVHRTGWRIHLSAHGRRSDLDPPRWERFHDIVRHGFGFPGHSPRRPAHPEALRLTAEWPGQSPVTSARARRAGEGRPDGPTLVGYWLGVVSMPEYVEADHHAWLWPRPSELPVRLVVEWPALEVPPTPVTLDSEQLAVVW